MPWLAKAKRSFAGESVGVKEVERKYFVRDCVLIASLACVRFNLRGGEVLVPILRAQCHEYYVLAVSVLNTTLSCTKAVQSRHRASTEALRLVLGRAAGSCEANEFTCSQGRERCTIEGASIK